tara:strand:- start:13102 stop:13404 length:303 start_codon:yes stop_codon:yes gene_type:complete
MEDFEIIITNDRKWKKLALLLQSEHIDGKNEQANVSIIPINHIPVFAPSPMLCTSIGILPGDYDITTDCVNRDIEDDIEELKREIKNTVKRGWSSFIDNI